MTSSRPPGKVRNHHYLPECYLKGWVGLDGRLVEFADRYKGVGHRWSSPGGTGYEPDLYSFPALGARSDALEKELMSMIDSSAALALNQMRALAPLQAPARAAFARLLTTFLVRNPPSIHALKRSLQEWRRKDRPETQAIYEAFIWGPGLPSHANDHFSANDTDEDLQDFLADTLRALLTHERIIEHLKGMSWRTLRMPEGAPLLLTGDQPMIASKGLDAKDSYLLLPLGPRRLFLATNSQLYAGRFLRDMGLINLATYVNQLVVERAHRFVYACDTSRLDWIAPRFGTKRIKNIGEKVAMTDPWGAGRPPGYTPDDAVADYIDWVSQKMDQPLPRG